MKEKPVKKPDFIFIGPGKTGTTWAYQVLREHPEIGIPSFKDIRFFDLFYDRGLKWYFNLFQELPGQVRGEVSTMYFHSEVVAERIQEHLPDVKLLCCLRNPVDRTISDYNYRRNVGEIKDSFETALEQSSIIAYGCYAKWLSNYRSFIDSGRLKILFYDQLVDDPEGFCQAMFDHIGVDSGFTPSILHTRVRPEGKSRSWFLGRLTFFVARFAKIFYLHSLVGWAKSSRWVKKLLYTETSDNFEPTWEQRQKLEKQFASDIQQLISEYGLETPRRWLTDDKEQCEKS